MELTNGLAFFFFFMEKKKNYLYIKYKKKHPGLPRKKCSSPYYPKTHCQVGLELRDPHASASQTPGL